MIVLLFVIQLPLCVFIPVWLSLSFLHECTAEGPASDRFDGLSLGSNVNRNGQIGTTEWFLVTKYKTNVNTSSHTKNVSLW